MTLEQATTAIALLEDLKFLAHVIALAACFGVGSMSYRLFLFAKNHREFW